MGGCPPLHRRSVSPSESTIDAGSFIRSLSDDTACWPTIAAQASRVWQTAQHGIAPHQDQQLSTLSWWTHPRSRRVARQVFIRSDPAERVKSLSPFLCFCSIGDSHVFDLYSATSFVDAHGTLNAELEVKLQKTHDMADNCIIC